MKRFFKITAVVACTLQTFTGITQANKAKNITPWQYSGLVQGALITGSNAATYAVQTLHGVQKKNWFTALGVGYDDYGMPGIPVVLHGQRFFTQQKDRPFVYVQAGLQFPLSKGEWNHRSWNGERMYDLKTGYLGDVGAGYSLSLGKAKTKAFIISVGYTYKICKADYHIFYYNDFPPYGDLVNGIEKQTFVYRRIAIKAGFSF